MDYPDEKGVTTRSKLEQVWKSSGYKHRDPKLDIEILIPIEVQDLWEWFWDLRSGTGGGGFGPSPISQQEIRAWMENMGVILTPWEVRMINTLDKCYMDYASKEIDKKSKQK